MASVFLG